MALRPSNNDNYNDHRKGNDKDNESDHGKSNANGNGIDNREEKSLRHVAMEQNFWMTTNRKRHLKGEFAQLQTSSILFNFI